MSELETAIDTEVDVHHEGYRSTRLRAPKRPLVPVPEELHALGELALDRGGALRGVVGRPDGDPRHRRERERERDHRDGGLADDARMDGAEAGHWPPVSAGPPAH